MFLSDPLTDPVVEILRLAYRRGLAIQRESDEKSKSVNMQALPNGILTVGQELAPEMEGAIVSIQLQQQNFSSK